MREVTKEEFYAKIGPMNVGPSPQAQETLWYKLDGSRDIVGKTWPGYRCEDEHGRYTTEKRYYLTA